jgi:hypothetical protein
MSDYYFITSKLNGYVLDVQGANTKAATPIINYPQKTSGTDNQLWQRIPTGPKDKAGGQSQYYLQSKLNNFVLDVSGGKTTAATPIINYPINSPASNNQIWQIVESSIDGYFYIVSLLNGYVLDVNGANKSPSTPIINYPQNTPTSDNQLWTFVLSTSSSTPPPKKSAFATSKKTAFANKTAFAKK